MTLYTDLNVECCAWLGSRVEDGSLPPGDVLLADVRHLNREHIAGYKHVHLFAGIGGFPLGLAWAGWPADLTVLTGGFPCPDISVAGKGAGIGTRDNPTARSGLFWELVRVAEIFGPEILLVENVGALSRRGLDVVAAALGEIGYVVPDAYRLGAWALGAPHERERWWIVGWRKHARRAIGNASSERGQRVPAGQRRPGAAAADIDGAGSREAQPDTEKPDADGHGQGAIGERGTKGRVTHGTLQDEPDTHGEQGRINEPERKTQGGIVVGWSDPVTGPWRREDDEWTYDGPPVFVYRSGTRRLKSEQIKAESFNPARPDRTPARGWPVPVLPGFEQHEWELPRLYQRGLGDAVHGLPGRLVDALNKCGVMALGNAIVPQCPKAIADGILRSIGR